MIGDFLKTYIFKLERANGLRIQIFNKKERLRYLKEGNLYTNWVPLVNSIGFQNKKLGKNAFKVHNTYYVLL